MNRHQNPVNHTEKKIDAALGLFAHARPPEGIEQRIHARLRREPFRVRRNLISRMSSFFFAQRLIFAAAGAALACCAIIIGSVQHSHQRLLPSAGIPISAPGSGLGAASGARIAPQPIPAPEHAQPRSERDAAGGRATVSRDAHKPRGVAVPESTAPQKP